MPTYKNNSSANVLAEDLAGNIVAVQPGDRIQTYRRYAVVDFEMVADTPYYNPVKAVDTLSRDTLGIESLSVVSGAEYIKVWKTTGPAKIYYQSLSNTPAVAVLRPGDYFAAAVRGYVTRLVFEFTDDSGGSLEVVQSSESFE